MDILKSFNKEKHSYHTITTNHPYLSEMGLSQFTTGVLYEWWNKKEDGQFINRKLVAFDDSNPSPEDLLISYSPNFLAPNNLTFKSWRKEGKGGRYKHFAIPWEDVNGHFNDRSFSSLRDNVEDYCSEIEPWSINAEIDAGLYGIEPAADYTFADLGLERFNNLAYNPETGEETAISGVYPITNIVALNDLYVYENNKINYSAGVHRPITAFLNDIKSSKNDSLYFLQKVSFNINLADGNFACFKEDVVEYRLQLFDYQAPKKTGKKVSFPGIVLSTDAVLSHGQVALNQEDGDGDLPVEENSPASKAAGELEVTYKPATGKFTSGTEQILAIISQQVPACDYSAGAEDLRNMDVAQTLGDPSSDEFFGVGSGLAIPITIQNGNPLQWTPSYKKPRGIRGEDLSKIEVSVFNPTPKSFAVDELVFLNKIDGVWVPLPIASGESSVTNIPGEISDWEFTYHMTNGVYFFRGGKKEGSSKVDAHTQGREEFEKISPTEMESYFHQRYYTEDDLNKEPAASYKGEKAFTNDGYFQVSSFDFMGPEVGGLREYDALKSTIWNLSTDGTKIETPEDGLAQHSAPFFGCVFPDGYASSKISSYKQEDSTFSAFPSGSLKMDKSDVTQYIRESHTLPSGPFQPALLPQDFSTRPYEAGVYDNSRTDNVFGKGRSMFEQDDQTLNHLPADIALNASPSGQNGRPLNILGRIQHYVTKFGESSSFREGDLLQKSVHDYWYDHEVWLHSSGQPYQSTYDFKPVNNKVLQFRPLSDAVYASVELGLGQKHDVLLKNTVGYLGSRAWQQHAYDRSPIQQGAYTRESIYANDLFGQKYTPEYNYLIDLSSNPELSNYSVNNYFNKDYWGSRDWTHPIGLSSFSAAKPAFGVGVIGAVCTATASQYITFTTTNYFGAPHYSDVAIPSDRLPSFGARGGRDFDDLQTTCLSVRLYQSWPRNQTIYDPRFFAVHHFNPGTELSGVVPPWEQNYELQEVITSGITYEGELIDVEIDVKMTEVDLKVPSIVENNNVVAIDDSYIIFADGATLGFGSTPKTILEQDYWKIDPQRRAKLLPYKYYKKSIGMRPQITSLALLEADVQAIVDNLTEEETITVSELLSNSSLDPYDVQFYIKNGGVGYTNTDKFTVEGPFGEQVELQAVVNPSAGMVIGFQVNKRGLDFRSENFAELGFKIKKVPLGQGFYTSNLKDSTSLKIVLQSDNPNAGQFEGYVLFGGISYVEEEDYKPKIATPDEDIIKISAESNTQGLIEGSNLNPAGGFGGGAFNFGAGGFGNGSITFGNTVNGFSNLSTTPGDLVYGINNTSVGLIDFSQDEEIHPLYRNLVYERNKFDIFFHFQNDISHTWMEYLGGKGDITFCRDQTINLEIFPF